MAEVTLGPKATSAARCASAGSSPPPSSPLWPAGAPGVPRPFSTRGSVALPPQRPPLLSIATDSQTASASSSVGGDWRDGAGGRLSRSSPPTSLPSPPLPSAESRVTPGAETNLRPSLVRDGLSRRPPTVFRDSDTDLPTQSARATPAPPTPQTPSRRPQLQATESTAPLLVFSPDPSPTGTTAGSPLTDGDDRATSDAGLLSPRDAETPRLFGQARLTQTRPPLLSLQFARTGIGEAGLVAQPGAGLQPLASTSAAGAPFTYPPATPSAYPFPTMAEGCQTPTGQLRRGNPEANFLGLRTRFRPLCLLTLGAAGNVLYGTGTVILERGVWAKGSSSLPRIGDGDDAVTVAMQAGNTTAGPPPPHLPDVVAGPGGKGVAHGGYPDYNAAFGGRGGGLAVGGVMTGLGILAAGCAATMFWRDARRLVRRNHEAAGRTGSPSYLWPNTYFTLHLFGIGLLVSYRFLVETTKDTNRPDWVWVSTLPGVLGSSIFSVTQAQSFSSSELFNGKMPLKGRTQISAIARGGVATYCLFAAMVGTPGFNPYVREVTRLVAMTFWTVACALPLTTARQVAANPQSVVVPSERTSWRPAVRLGLILAGRALMGFGPGLFERGLYTALFAQEDLASEANQGINQHHFDANGRSALADLSVGAVLTSIGVTLDCVAIVALNRDMHELGVPRRRRHGLFAAHALASACLVLYRAIIELAKDKLSAKTLWLSTLPGLVGTALHFVTVPEQFSYSELLHGDIPMAQRDRVTKLVRCFAGCAFPLWAAMSAIIGFDQFVREAVFIAAAGTGIFAMALPTTTTRRGRPQFAFPRTPAPGYTPTAPVLPV